jgi:hypothetical protein
MGVPSFVTLARISAILASAGSGAIFHVARAAEAVFGRDARHRRSFASAAARRR